MNTEERIQKHQYSMKEDFDFSVKSYRPSKEEKKQKNTTKEKFNDSLKNYHPNKGE